MTANYMAVFCSKQVQPHNTAIPSPSLGHAQLCRTNVGCYILFFKRYFSWIDYYDFRRRKYLWSRWRPSVVDRVIRITAWGFSQSPEEIWRQRHALQSSFLPNITNSVPEWDKVQTVLLSFIQQQDSGIKTDPK